MPILPPAAGPIPAQQPGGTCTLKGVDIIKQAMLEIGAIDPNENPTGPESASGLIKLNRMLDAWNVDKKYVFTVNFAQYIIVPNLQPHLLGPSGTAGWFVPQRPVKLESAEIILNNVQPNIRYPLNIRDATWWAQKSSYQVPGTLPTDVYYEPDWPNGSLFIWPVPTINYPLEVQTWTVLSEVQLNTTICLPPGYLDCICYELAVALCPTFQTRATPELLALTKVARDRIFSPNITSPRIYTRDAGIPQMEKHRATFNYRTGSDR